MFDIVKNGLICSSVKLVSEFLSADIWFWLMFILLRKTRHSKFTRVSFGSGVVMSFHCL